MTRLSISKKNSAMFYVGEQDPPSPFVPGDILHKSELNPPDVPSLPQLHPLFPIFCKYPQRGLPTLLVATAVESSFRQQKLQTAQILSLSETSY